MPSTPTTGVYFTDEDIQRILASLQPPLALLSFSGTELGYNNRIYFILTTCGREMVLKAGGKYWKRQKTEAEVAGLLALNRIPRIDINIPQLVGFSSRTGGDAPPWEWVLLERLPGKTMEGAWDMLSEDQKVVVARKLGNIVVRIQSITPSALGIEETYPQYGNLSLTRPEDDATGLGHDHVSIDISQPLYISHTLNGPPPSMTYLAHSRALLNTAIDELGRRTQRTRSVYHQHIARIPRLRRLSEQLQADPPPPLRAMDESARWRPVFTHGDLQPQNILLHGDTIVVLDWEWCGFLPPHIEWDAGLNVLIGLLESSEGSRAKEVFFDVLHAGCVSTQWSTPAAEWEAAVKLSRLTECVDSWWLDEYPDDGGGTEEERREIAAKGDAAVLELDELLKFFGV